MENKLPEEIKDLTKLSTALKLWDNLDEVKGQLSKKDFAKLRSFILNFPPPEKWVQKHPMHKSKYLPIGRVEFLLTYLFDEWWIEIKEVKTLFQSACVVVRLYYKDDEEIKFQDGVGAAAYQFKSKSDMNNINNIQVSAVAMSVPIAESEAIKDASHKIGKIFGADLNRKVSVPFTLNSNLDNIKL